MGAFIDLSGRRYGTLIVKELHWEKTKTNHCKWVCNCDCGKTIFVSGSSLNTGNTKSCGCTPRDKITDKNGNRSREYSIWMNMRTRCYNSKHIRFMDYGGRGIRVCKRWLDDFECFAQDMGKCPAGMSLDRKNNNKNYTISNCRWATPTQQALNKRNSLSIIINRKKYNSDQFCLLLSITRGQLYYYYDKKMRFEDIYLKFTCKN